MSEHSQMSDSIYSDKEPESPKETFNSPEFSMDPAEVMNLSASGITDQTAEHPDDLMIGDENIFSLQSSSTRDHKSVCSVSEISQDENNGSICTSVWSSADSGISEEITPEVRSEETRGLSPTNFDNSKMSDFQHTDLDKGRVELMTSDDPLKDQDVTSLPATDDDGSYTLSWCSLSSDSRSSHAWDYRPSSRGSFSSINSDILTDTEEDATIKDIKSPQLSDSIYLDKEPESPKETFNSPEFPMDPAEVMNLSASGITDQAAEYPDDLMIYDDPCEDEDIYSLRSSSSEDKSICSVSEISQDENNGSICTSVWSSADSGISEEITPEVRSEETRGLSPTNTDDLGSYTLSWCSLSEDSRSSHASSRGSFSSINSDISTDTEEDSAIMDIKAPQLEQEVQEERVNNNHAPNFERSSPAAQQVEETHSSQSQSQDRSEVVLQVEVKSFAPRSLNDDTHESSLQEEMETEKVKRSSPETEPSVSAPASSTTENDPERVLDSDKKEDTPAGCETKKKPKGRFFRWLRRKRIQPAPLNPTAEDCYQADSEEKPEVSCETKAKESKGFMRFFSKMLPKKKQENETEKEEEKIQAEPQIQQPPFWVRLICCGHATRVHPQGPNQDELKKAV